MRKLLIFVGTTLYAGVFSLQAGVITLNCPTSLSGPFTVVSNIVGGNSLTNLFRGAAFGTIILLWDAAIEDYVAYNVRGDLGTPPNPILRVQSGFFVNSLVNQTFTWTNLDATVTPQPLILQSNTYYLLGPASNGISRYENIVGAPPNNETSLFRYVGGTGGSVYSVYPPKPPSWKAYHYVDGAWTPEEPVLNPLEAAFIVYPTLRITATITGAPPFLVLTWPRATYGALEVAEQASGPWQAVSGAQSPYVVNPAGTNLSRSYRVREWP